MYIPFLIIESGIEHQHMNKYWEAAPEKIPTARKLIVGYPVFSPNMSNHTCLSQY